MSSDAILSSMSHSLASMTVQKSVASVHTTQPKFVTGRIAAKRQTAGMDSRTQCSRPRPRPDNLEAKAKAKLPRGRVEA